VVAEVAVVAKPEAGAKVEDWSSLAAATVTPPQRDPYRAIVDDLAYTYEGVFPRDGVAAAVA
jgi:hypothetical protein